MADSIEKQLVMIESTLQLVIAEPDKYNRDAITDAQLLSQSTKQLQNSLSEMRENARLYSTNLNIAPDFISLCDDNVSLFREWADLHQITVPSEVV